jgi:hypothetical protein
LEVKKEAVKPVPIEIVKKSVEPVEPVEPVEALAVALIQELKAEAKSETKAAVDERLAEFVARSERFYGMMLESLPAGFQVEDSVELFKERLEEGLTAVLRLPELAGDFSTVWPPAVRNVLPLREPGVAAEQTWSPILAWVVLGSLPGAQTRVFDELQLRSALGEIFASMGMDEERKWRTAARVRVLLMEAVDRDLYSQEFWADGDVRWLAGVHEAADVTYMNKELFEELVCWLQLPGLLDLDLAVVETVVAGAVERARVAGYVLDAFLAGPVKVVSAPVVGGA